MSTPAVRIFACNLSLEKKGCIEFVFVVVCLLLINCESSKPSTLSAQENQAKTGVQGAHSMSAAELIEIRRKAGFKDLTDILTESAKLREKDARQYIKVRMPEYRKLVTDLQQNTHSISEASQEWPKTKNPQQAFDRWNRQHIRKTQKLIATYDALTQQETQGGATQVLLGRSFHTWENLNNDLSPDISQKALFHTLLQEINRGFKDVENALDDIDQDESLIVDRFYQSKPKKTTK